MYSVDIVDEDENKVLKQPWNVLAVLLITVFAPSQMPGEGRDGAMTCAWRRRRLLWW